MELGLPLQRRQERKAVCGFCQCPETVCVWAGVGTDPEFTVALAALGIRDVRGDSPAEETT